METQWNGDKIINSIRQRILDKLELVGAHVEGEAKTRCPVDTGNLRQSITHKVNDAEASVRIGTNVEYAAHVEFGTIKMNTQPYLRPALLENKQAIGKILGSGFTSSV